MFKIVIIILFSFVIVGVCCATNIKTTPPPPDWVEHLDVIVPGVTYAVKVLIWTIGSLLSLLGTIIGAGIVWMVRRQKRIEAKIDKVHEVMLECDGCRASAIKYGRRAGDTIEDNQDSLFP